MSKEFGSPVCDVVTGYFDEQTRRLAKNFHLSLAAATIDSIHDLRVAAKRVRALFQLIEWLDKRFESRRLFRPIRRLFRAAGPIRDNHVQQEICRAGAKDLHLDLSGYSNYLLEQELTYREQYFAKAGKFDLSLVGELRSTITNTLRGSSDDELLFRMGQRLDLQVADVVSMTNHSRLTDEQRHQIRISTKAVRYTLEVRRLSPLANDSHEELNNLLRSCHQALGLWHDHQVGSEWLTEYLKNRVDGPLVAADGYVVFARRLKRELDAHLRSFEEAWLSLRDFVRGSSFSLD